MRRRLLCTGFVLWFCAVAEAQVASTAGDISIQSFNPDNAVAPLPGVEGRGVKIGEGTTLYPVVGISTGAVSNVFYEDTSTNAAGILRLLAQVGVGSLSSARLSPTAASTGGGPADSGSFQYRASARLAYDFMLTNNEAARAVGGLGAGVTLRSLVNPSGKVSFGVDDNYNRLIRAANFETDADTTRDINALQLNLIFHPPGRSLSGYLYYANTIDVFERSSQRFADRLQQRVGIHPNWQWLPKTAIFGDASFGFYGGIGNSTKVSSYPLVAQLGIATLITARTTFNAHGGYTNGFYSSGPSYSSAFGGVQLGYRYSPLGRALVTYDLMFEDSVNANYYRDHVFRLNLEQLFAPLALMVQPELHLRQYNGISAVMGPPTRNDIIVSVVAGLMYNFRDQVAAVLDYRFSMVQTDYRYMIGMVMDDPSFVRHQLMLGVSWAL